MTGHGWRDAALCRHADPDVFFPTNGDYRAAQAALELCRRCPVAGPCRDYAVSAGVTHGIWGALSEQQLARTVRAGRRSDAA